MTPNNRTDHSVAYGINSPGELPEYHRIAVRSRSPHSGRSATQQPDFDALRNEIEMAVSCHWHQVS
jgi:hypothetical protein